jgi:tripartite-type tricarboxylate transporter receptor subunit TctC
MPRVPAIIGTIVGAFLAAALPARADDVAEFYKGKVITLTVSAGAGGGYDTLARTLARFLGRHVPGEPIAIVRNMAGGGGLAAANFIYTGAEKDGRQIGLLQNNAAFEPLLGNREARFDATKFAWLGTPSVETGLLAVWHAVPVQSLQEARNRDVTVAAAGANSPPAFYARLFNSVFGLRLKVANGFPGQTEAFYAMEKGEIEGSAGVLYSALQVAKPDWLPQKKITPLLYYGPDKRPEFGNLPYATDAAASEDDRSLLEAAFAPLALGRPLVMPPGVPGDRVAAIRKALAATFADPEFLAESKRLVLGADTPRGGEEIAAAINRVYAKPQAIRERWQALQTGAR